MEMRMVLLLKDALNDISMVCLSPNSGKLQ